MKECFNILSGYTSVQLLWHYYTKVEQLFCNTNTLISCSSCSYPLKGSISSSAIRHMKAMSSRKVKQRLENWVYPEPVPFYLPVFQFQQLMQLACALTLIYLVHNLHPRCLKVKNKKWAGFRKVWKNSREGKADKNITKWQNIIILELYSTPFKIFIMCCSLTSKSIILISTSKWLK